MLINREVAIKAVQDYGITAINAGRTSLDVVDDIVELVRKIQDIPTADAVPVVHGEWVRHYDDSGKQIGDEWYCSECSMCNDRRRTWHCPHCGVKMDRAEI